MDEQERKFRQAIAALREHQQQSTPFSASTIALLGLRQLSGGMNNIVYSLPLGGTTYCIKLYRVDQRRRAEREWLSLNLLMDQGLAIAPVPLLYNADPYHPAVVMTMLAGRSLHHIEIGAHELGALASILKSIFAITPQDALYPYTRVGDPANIVERLEHWINECNIDRSDSLEAAINQLQRQWLASDDRLAVLSAGPAVFSPGDPNLANYVWDGKRIGVMDWEYGGWSDRVFQLADLVEGIWARRLSDDIWQGFIEHFELDEVEKLRWQAARRTFALFWVMLLLQRRERHDPQLAAQVQRAQQLVRVAVRSSGCPMLQCGSRINN